jgi:hypothetical protein
MDPDRERRRTVRKISIWGAVLSLFAILLVFTFEVEQQKNAKVADETHLQSEQFNRLAESLVYFQDRRGPICFAYKSDRAHTHDGSITVVDCEKVRHLLVNAVQEKTAP